MCCWYLFSVPGWVLPFTHTCTALLGALRFAVGELSTATHKISHTPHSALRTPLHIYVGMRAARAHAADAVHASMILICTMTGVSRMRTHAAYSRISFYHIFCTSSILLPFCTRQHLGRKLLCTPLFTDHTVPSHTHHTPCLHTHTHCSPGPTTTTTWHALCPTPPHILPPPHPPVPLPTPVPPGGCVFLCLPPHHHLPSVLPSCHWFHAVILQPVPVPPMPFVITTHLASCHIFCACMCPHTHTFCPSPPLHCLTSRRGGMSTYMPV